MIDLYIRIAMYRARLNKVGEKYGLSDPRVLALSRKLDKLIFRAMKLDSTDQDK